MIKNRFFSVAAAFFLCFAAQTTQTSAQNVLLKKSFGGNGSDYYESITAVSDGFVAVGDSNYGSFGNGDWTGVTGKDGFDAIIVKYDKTGNVQWKKNFGGNAGDYYYSVTAVSDGFVAVGYSNSGSFGNGDWTGVTGKGGDDAIIVKYDNAGNVQWKKNFGGDATDFYRSVTAVSDGFVAVGYSYSGSFGNGDWTGVSGKGGTDAIIVKYDNAGNVQWKKNFGGNAADYYRSVTAVSDGFVVVGYSASDSFGNGDWTGVTGKGDVDAIIVKYDKAGNVQWKRNFGGNANNYYYSVTAVSDGFVAVGHSYSGSFGNGDWTGVSGKGGVDAIVVKYDNAGNVQWKKNYGGNAGDYYSSVTAVSDGFVAVGYSFPDSFGNGDWTGVTGKGGSDAIIVKYDNAGNVQWKKNYGGNENDSYYSVTAVSDGFVAVGYSYPGSFGNGDWTGVTGKGGYDAIVVKYSISVSNISDVPVNDLQVYPNPTGDVLNFSIETPFEIIDLQGRILLRSDKAVTSVNVSSLPSGTYFVKLTSETGRIVRQIIKE